MQQQKRLKTLRKLFGKESTNYINKVTEYKMNIKKSFAFYILAMNAQ